jgi:hypothetical protein
MWCALVHAVAAAFSVTTFSMKAPVRHARIVGGQVLVVTDAESTDHHDRGIRREIARLTVDRGATSTQPVTLLSGLAMFAAAPRGSDDVVVIGNQWWYVTTMNGMTAAITFVDTDGERVKQVKPQGLHTYVMALSGEKPRALAVSDTGDEFLAREIGWDGALRSWRLPRGNLWPHMMAAYLPDGRIALFSNSGGGLTEFTLSDDGVVDTTVLRNLRLAEFAMAIDAAGRIAIVTVRVDDGLIEGAVSDVSGLGAAQWRVLGRRARTIAARPQLRVTASGSRFVAAWINDENGRHIEALDFNATGPSGHVVEIGRASPRGTSAFFDLQATDDALHFFWDDGDQLYYRRLPASLATYASFEDLARFCGVGEQ